MAHLASHKQLKASVSRKDELKRDRKPLRRCLWFVDQVDESRRLCRELRSIAAVPSSQIILPARIGFQPARTASIARRRRGVRSWGLTDLAALRSGGQAAGVGSAVRVQNGKTARVVVSDPGISAQRSRGKRSSGRTLRTCGPRGRFQRGGYGRGRAHSKAVSKSVACMGSPGPQGAP